MPVDLSGVLRPEFNKAKKAYEKATKDGSFKLARLKALRCAQLLKQLAENVPSQKSTYEEHARKWETIAKSIADGAFKKVTEKEEHEEEFSGYIEGLISESPVRWNDIGGLEEPKQLLMETVVIAALNKPVSIKPWRGILLFGPPGTGKTLLAAAAAGSLEATFFNVSADKVLSKYYGETSKLIATLYEVATSKAANTPSIIFIDEFDAMSPSRESEISEASRRALGTLLSQLDGFRDKKTDKLVLTLAATNAPWDLDDACLSRFPRRIYVPLPDPKAIEAIIEIQMKDLIISGLSLSSISQECVRRYYSGRDISYLCQQAMWNMIREVNKDLHKLSALPYQDLKKRSLNTRPISSNDFSTAFAMIKSPLNPETIQKHGNWAQEFGG